MKILNQMTEEAELAAARYGSLVESWRAIFRNAIDASDFGSARQIGRINKEAYLLASRFLNEEEATARAVFHTIALQAHQTTIRELRAPADQALSDDADAHLNAAVDYLRRELAIQIERDIAFLERSVRRAFMHISLDARAANTPLRIAKINYQIGNTRELHFFFHDRQNRRLASRKYVRSLWRLGLLGTYNETVLLDLAEHGLNRAVIHHTSQKAGVDGMQVALSPSLNMPTYGEICDEVFHPNAEAFLGAPDVPA